mgnify:CR=1|jgi:hypothetical protein|tara:strand:- start:5217 stop:5360 length:144 start_codon:yes stop_codon:yes gene_type:complete
MNKIDKFIADNGLIVVLNNPSFEVSLWEDVGGNIWTWDQILEAVERS